MPLTDAQIKRLKPRNDRYAISDGRGLAREVYAHRRRELAIPLSVQGKTEKVSLGQYPLLSLKEVRTKREEYAMAVIRGESPVRRKQMEKVALANASTVRDFGERNFAEVAEKDRKDATQLRRYLVNEIYPAFGSMSMRDVTAQDVQRLVFHRRDNGFEAAAAQLRNLLKRIFDYAVVCSLGSINPAHATPTRFITRARPRTHDDS